MSELYNEKENLNKLILILHLQYPKKKNCTFVTFYIQREIDEHKLRILKNSVPVFHIHAWR